MRADETTEERPEVRGSPAMAISNTMVRLLREYTGRGPTRARTYLHEDVITIVLQDTLTRGELSLVAQGKADHVRHTRQLFQDALKADAIADIEEITGRRVLAFLSDNHIDPDLAVETLVLHPRSDGAGSDGAGSDGRGPAAA